MRNCELTFLKSSGQRAGTWPPWTSARGPFNQAQLRVIVDAFEDARASLAERVDEERVKKVEAIRKNEYTRTVTLHKAQKRFR